MSAKTKKKLCWNCEGNVELKHENCPYCGVSLNVSPLAGTKTHADLAPPYRVASNHSSSIPNAPYSSPSSETESKTTDKLPSTGEFQAIAISLTFLFIGSVFGIFGILLFLFSDSQGVFTLSWHGSYWYIYVLLALPLLFLGWKVSHQLNNHVEESSD